MKHAPRISQRFRMKQCDDGAGDLLPGILPDYAIAPTASALRFSRAMQSARFRRADCAPTSPRGGDGFQPHKHSALLWYGPPTLTKLGPSSGFCEQKKLLPFFAVPSQE
jgi:hypothetical protein